jgi:putative multiple sugar transport system permease protein
MAFSLLLACYKGVPVVGLILGLLVAIYTFVTRKTVFGRHIYSMGATPWQPVCPG